MTDQVPMNAEPRIPIWPTTLTGEAPEDVPTLEWFPASGSAEGCVLVCPGGGYAFVSDTESYTIAHWLNRAGWHAAVLRYRVGPRHRFPAQLYDAERAMRMIRAEAGSRGFDPQRVAAVGFSAGGHLVSMLAVQPEPEPSPDDDLAPQFDSRPAAVVLCYPVIDLAGDHRHEGSRFNLLGPDAPADLSERLSTHQRVDSQTPPSFLWHTADDGGVAMAHSMQFAAACRAADVPVELHIYESGRHGLALAEDAPDVAGWPDLAARFLARHL